MCLDRSVARTSAKDDFNRSTAADWLIANCSQLIAPFMTKGYTAEKESAKHGTQSISVATSKRGSGRCSACRDVLRELIPRLIGTARQMTREQDVILADAWRFGESSSARQRSLSSPFAYAWDRGDGNGRWGRDRSISETWLSIPGSDRQH